MRMLELYYKKAKVVQESTNIDVYIETYTNFNRVKLISWKWMTYKVQLSLILPCHNLRNLFL